MRHRKVRRLRGRHQIVWGLAVGILFLRGLHICLSLFLLALRLLHHLFVETTLTRCGIVVSLALRPVLIIGQVQRSLRRLSSRRGQLLGLLTWHYVLGVQEVSLMECVGPRAVQLHLAFPTWTLREGLRAEQDVVLMDLVEVGGGWQGDMIQAVLIVGRTVRDASKWHCVGVLHLELVALREDGSVCAAISTRRLRALLAFAQAQVRPSSCSLSTRLLCYTLKLRRMLRRHSMLLTIIKVHFNILFKI